jgi:hypothetical protein
LKKLQRKQTGAYFTYGSVVKQIYRPKVGLTCYETKLRPVLEYAAPIWGGLTQYLADELESIQTRSVKILGLPLIHFSL